MPAFFSSLEREVQYLGENKNKIEVVLFNNASTDNSPKLAQEFSNKAKYSKFFSSNDKVSAEKSLQQAVSFCLGDYVWLIGDDYLYNNALGTVVRTINEKQPDILIVNSLLYRSNEAITDRHYQNRLDNFPSLTSKLRALGSSYNHFFISNFIAKRHIVHDIAENSTSQWPHSETLIRYLDCGNDKLEIIQSTPIVIESESRWYSDASYCLETRANTLLELVQLANIPTIQSASQLVQEQANVLFISNFIYLKLGDKWKIYQQLRQKYDWSIKQIIWLAFRKIVFRLRMFTSLTLVDPEAAKNVILGKTKSLIRKAKLSR
jgi:glycosyltransferase involved in cell wall biosynthesis